MPDVTLLISTRERHSAALESLESIFEHTAAHVPIVYADIAAPESIASKIKAKLAERKAEYRRFELPIMPQDVRIALIPSVQTKYVVFIDNDVLVEPHWLEKLVGCAEQTNATLVGPIYLWTDGVAEPTVHMAGGVMTRLRDETGKHLDERHDLINAPLCALAGMRRKPVDFLEYHCMLARTDFVQETGVLSAEITTVHEHIDLALKAKSRGLSIVLEPTVQITYLGKFTYLALHDVAFFRKRWSQSSARHSLHAFAKAYGLEKDAVLFDKINSFLKSHRERHDVFAVGLKPTESAAPLEVRDIAQSRIELVQQLAKAGYSDEELQSASAALTLAMVLFDGIYRCDGRPFLAHAIGTASVLAHARAKAPLIIAGLLHAAYTHRPITFTKTHIHSALTARGAWVEALVARYTAKPTAPKIADDEGTTDDLAIAMMEAANEIDMIMSGEYAASGRPPELSPAKREELTAILTLFGERVLIEALNAVPKFHPAATQSGYPGIVQSFRIGSGGTQLVPVQTHEL